jgi:uroporphyrinogen decarboxylase
MTPRDRVLCTLRGGQADRVPYDITHCSNGLGGFNREAARLFRQRTGSDNPDEYFGVQRDVAWVDLLPTRLDLAQRYLPYHRLTDDLTYVPAAPAGEAPRGYPAAKTFSLLEWGTALVSGSNASYDHFVPPARLAETASLEDIEQYPLPDYDAQYRYAHLDQELASIRRRELASVAFMAMTIFEIAWQIRGMNQLLSDMLAGEDTAACLLDRITALSCLRASRYAAAGVDVIHVGDDVGMQDRMFISPQTWQKWLKPRLARVVAAAREVKPDVVFFYHSDGFVEPIIPELIEIGIDALNPVQPECMDPALLKERYGDRLAFWGTIGIQHTLPFGTPEDVAAEVKLRIETVGKGGGLYLAPTHVIAPEVPYENLFALVEAAKKYGRYE